MPQPIEIAFEGQICMALRNHILDAGAQLHIDTTWRM